MALGKLGGRELNYSSDIDLLGLCSDPAAAREGAGDPREHERRDLFDRVMEALRHALSAHTEEGSAYRVDLRLRPYGRSGNLVRTVGGLLEYYRTQASLWEIQALLKMRPVAGNLDVGRRFLERARALFQIRRDPRQVVSSVHEMRRKALRAHAARPGATVDVKSGLGGLRDIEFLVQGLQLIHAPDEPALVCGNTVEALRVLGEGGFLSDDAARELTEDYLFLRRVEHCLQILEDRQIHALPSRVEELAALARRVLGPESDARRFMAALNERQDRVREVYERHFLRLGG
jgi:glutamate-ammonia-ligase adenylyltransferase